MVFAKAGVLAWYLMNDDAFFISAFLLFSLMITLSLVTQNVVGSPDIFVLEKKYANS